MIEYVPILLKGVWFTLQIATLSLAIGFAFGLIFGVLTCNRLKISIVSTVINLFVLFIRGTPVYVQILITYFALPELIGINLSPFIAGVLALGVNSTAYVTEIIKCGINTIGQGQWDAAYVLGYSKYKTLKYIIIPQMLKNVLPILTNESVSLIKETCLLSSIGVLELTKTGKNIIAYQMNPITIWPLVAVLYLIMTVSITYFSTRLEKRIKQ